MHLAGKMKRKMKTIGLYKETIFGFTGAAKITSGTWDSLKST